MPPTPTITRHPIRAALYGLLLGIGVAIYLVLFSVVRFGEWVTLGIVVVAAIVVGVAWAYVAPTKKPKGYKDHLAQQQQQQRPVPEYGGVEQVVVKPQDYSSQPPKTQPAAAQPSAAEPPAAEPSATEPPAAEPPGDTETF